MDLFRAVTRQRRPLDQALEESQAWAVMDGRDKGFARLLASTLLRRQGTLDDLLRHCLSRPLRDRDSDLRDLLRLGTAQLIFLNTPAHAAISTTLRLAERNPRLRGQKRLLNGVLARIDREGKDLLEKLEKPGRDAPLWLWRRWVEAYGEERAGGIALANRQEAELDITARDNRDGLQANLDKKGIESQPLFDRSLRLTGWKGDPTTLPGFDEGLWWVQDAAAALTAGLLAVEPGERVIDLCAAPGGKSAYLAAQGAKVTAVEKSAARSRRLRENMQRLKLPVDCVEADALQWRPAEPATAILLDAPCSGTGTLRRHPDIARLRREEDLEALCEIQRNLLDAALQMLAPGGRLLYAVCSLEPEEGEEQVSALLTRQADLVRRPFAFAEDPIFANLFTEKGELRSLPRANSFQVTLDGFYACLIEKSQ